MWILVVVVSIVSAHLLYLFHSKKPDTAEDEKETIQMYKEAMLQNRRHSTKIAKLSTDKCALEGQVRILQREMNQLRTQLRSHLYKKPSPGRIRTNTPMNSGSHPSPPDVDVNRSWAEIVAQRSTQLPQRQPLLHLKKRQRTKKCTQVHGIDVFTGNLVESSSQPSSLVHSGVATPGPTPIETPLERTSEQMIQTTLNPFNRLHSKGGVVCYMENGPKMLSPVETYAPVSTPLMRESSSPMPTALGSPMISQDKQRKFTKFVFGSNNPSQ